jgi:hypothetical protein
MRYKVSRIIHEADWERHGKKAGPIRNRLIVRDADVGFAFFTDWSNSKGTMNCLKQMRDADVPAISYDAKSDKFYDHSGGAMTGSAVTDSLIDFAATLEEMRRVIESTARPSVGA